MKYRYEYMNQGQLGKLFGETSHKVGDWLKDLGLRKRDGKPSSEAFNRNLVSQNYDANGTYCYVWHADRTVVALETAGHKRIPDPPLMLAEPPTLLGPFSLRESKNGTWQLLGSNDEVAIVVTGEANAKVVIRFLNLAHNCGKIEQLLSVHN